MEQRNPWCESDLQAKMGHALQKCRQQDQLNLQQFVAQLKTDSQKWASRSIGEFVLSMYLFPRLTTSLFSALLATPPPESIIADQDSKALLVHFASTHADCCQ